MEPQQNNNVTAYVSTPNILRFELAKKDRTVINHSTSLIEVAADPCLDGCLCLPGEPLEWEPAAALEGEIPINIWTMFEIGQ